MEQWIKGIELGEYVEGLGRRGIHGAIMVRGWLAGTQQYNTRQFAWLAL